jgi:hypothetical protein
VALSEQGGKSDSPRSGSGTGGDADQGFEGAGHAAAGVKRRNEKRKDTDNFLSR